MVTLDAPVTKTSSSILAFQKDEAAEAKETACINCGRCVSVCPGHVLPARLAKLAERGDMAGFEALDGMGMLRMRMLQLYLSCKETAYTEYQVHA